MKCSEIADSSGGDKLVLTDGLLILHAEKWISIQWHSGAVFYMMYILYCSTHCNFYWWTIKQRGEKCDWFIFCISLFRSFLASIALEFTFHITLCLTCDSKTCHQRVLIKYWECYLCKSATVDWTQSGQLVKRVEHTRRNLQIIIVLNW